MAPNGDARELGGGAGIGEQGKADGPDCATADAACRARVAAADKVFQGWRARFAIAGWALYITATDGRTSFVVTRWGQVREFDTLAELERFAAQVGVQC